MKNKKNPAQYIKDRLKKKKSVGGAINLGVGLFDMLKNMNQQTEQFNSQVNKLNYNESPYFEEGGQVGFKQYNAPDHSQGGQTVDESGDPNPAGNNEIEGTENKYTYTRLPSKTYVFSDKNGTSDMVKGIIDKYKNKNTNEDLATRASMEMEIKDVENLNELINVAKQNVNEVMEAKYGKKLNGGGILSPLSNSNTTPFSGMTPRKTIDPMNQLSNSSTTPAAGLVPKGWLPPIQLPALNSVKSNTPTSMTALPIPNVKFEGDPNDNPIRKIDYGNILRSTGLVGSAIDAFRKPDVEETILPDYSTSDQRFNKMNANLTQAKQESLGASNMASKLNRNASSSFSQYRARELSNIGNLQNSLASISANEQQLRNNILSQQGQYETNKAVTEARIKDDVQQRNLANKAKVQDLQKLLFSDVVSEGDRLSTIANNKEINQARIAEGMQLLKQMAPDFDINESFVENLIKVSKGEMEPSKLNAEEMLIFNSMK